MQLDDYFLSSLQFLKQPCLVPHFLGQTTLVCPKNTLYFYEKQFSLNCVCVCVWDGGAGGGGVMYTVARNTEAPLTLPPPLLTHFVTPIQHKLCHSAFCEQHFIKFSISLSLSPSET